MQYKLFNDTMAVISSITPEMFTDIMAQNPSALVLVEGEGKEKKETFRFGRVSAGNGGITNYGISFDSITPDNKLSMTVCIVTDAHVVSNEERVESFTKHFHGAMAKAALLEAQVMEAVENLAVTLADAQAAVEIVG